MARAKRLNILNTDRHLNVNLMKREDIENKVKVHRLNEEEIEQEMDELHKKSRRYPIRNNKEYLIYQEKYTNDTLIAKIIQHGGGVSYYTNTILPYQVLTQLSRNLNSEVIYSIRKPFTDKEQENIELSYMGTKVIIDCPVVIPDTNPYDLLFCLEKIKTNVDKVQLSFPPLRETEIAERHKEYYEKIGDLYYVKASYKYKYFQHVQTSLSLWKMNIWLVTNTPKEHKELTEIIDKVKEKRSPKKKKVKEEPKPKAVKANE